MNTDQIFLMDYLFAIVMIIAGCYIWGMILANKQEVEEQTEQDQILGL